MRDIFASRHLTLGLKKRMVKCYVWSTLLYGCETWTLTTELENKLKAFEMWIYRRMFRISYMDKITNDEVLQRAKAKRQLISVIRDRKMRYFGHLVRRNELQRLLLDGKVEGKRRKGRQRLCWVFEIQKWTSMKYQSYIRMAEDRTAWRAMVAHVRNGPGTND